jgi:hypothetical protein
VKISWVEGGEVIEGLKNIILTICRYVLFDAGQRSRVRVWIEALGLLQHHKMLQC